MLGASLGLVFVPCAGPVLATISVVAATNHVGLRAILLTIVYAAGAAGPMLLIALGGRQLAGRLRTQGPRVRFASGVVIGLVALAIAFNLDSRFQTALPGYTQALQSHIEETATADVGRIKDAYKKIGRAAIKVSYRLVTLPNGRVDLVFTIDEGEKTGVKSINFVGNNNVSGSRLKGLMQLSEMNFLSWFKTSDVYNPDTLATDEEAIRKYYMRIGYADFRIVNTDVAYHDDNGGGYVITIAVDEGPLYRVSGVTVTSSDTDLTGASETITNYQSGDSLNFTNGTITGVYTAGTGTLVLTGTGSTTAAQFIMVLITQP